MSEEVLCKKCKGVPARRNQSVCKTCGGCGKVLCLKDVKTGKIVSITRLDGLEVRS